MGLYITCTNKISSRKVDHIFFFNKNKELIDLVNKKEVVVNSNNDSSKLDSFKSVVEYASSKNINSYEILVENGNPLEDIVIFLTNYILDKELSVGLITKDQELFNNHVNFLEENGVALLNPFICYSPSYVPEPDFYVTKLANKVENKGVFRALAKPAHIVLEESFHDKFMKLLIESGEDNATIYKRAGVSRQVFSKIISNKDLIPTKLTIISLCIGLELTYPDAVELLESAGYSLSKSIMFDSIIIEFLKAETYDYFIINSELDEYGCPLLGWHPRED